MLLNVVAFIYHSLYKVGMYRILAADMACLESGLFKEIPLSPNFWPDLLDSSAAKVVSLLWIKPGVYLGVLLHLGPFGCAIKFTLLWNVEKKIW